METTAENFFKGDEAAPDIMDNARSVRDAHQCIVDLLDPIRLPKNATTTKKTYEQRRPCAAAMAEQDDHVAAVGAAMNMTKEGSEANMIIGTAIPPGTTRPPGATIPGSDRGRESRRPGIPYHYLLRLRGKFRSVVGNERRAGNAPGSRADHPKAREVLSKWDEH